MNPTRLMTLPCTLSKIADDGPIDEYGNPTETTTTLASTCWMHQSVRDEANANASTQTETWRFYFPPDVDIEGYDRNTVAGVTYEFVGPPWRAFNPRLESYTHYEATARRTV